MSAHFIDTSGLVKRYVNEAGSAWVRPLLSPHNGHVAYVLSLTQVEIASAFFPRHRRGAMSASQIRSGLTQFRHDMMYEYREIDPAQTTIALATVLVERHGAGIGLRAYDAVRLASALELRATLAGAEPMTTVSADADLNRAAAAEPLTTENPNDHP